LCGKFTGRPLVAGGTNMARKGHMVFLAFDVPLQAGENCIFDVWKMFTRSVHIAQGKLAPLKIAIRHYAAMALLATSDSTTQSTLVKSMGLSPNVVLAMIDYLDDLGYTRRVQNPRNRRENIVLLSKKGRDVYDRAVRLLRQAEQELMAPLSDEDGKRWRELSKKLEESAPSKRELAMEVNIH